MNAITISGFLTIQPEIRDTKDGKHICTFNVAVSRGKDKLDFFKVVAFGDKAEVCNKWLKKGSKVIINGSMVNEQYTGKDNKRHDSWQLSLMNIEFISKIRKDKGEDIEEDENLVEVNDSIKNKEATDLFSAFGNMPF